MGNLTGQAIQVDVDIPIMTSGKVQIEHSICFNLFCCKATSFGSDATVPSTSFFVACTLNATNTTLSLPMQNGQMIPTEESSSNESATWGIWSPGSTTELTQMVFGPTYTIFHLG